MTIARRSLIPLLLILPGLCLGAPATQAAFPGDNGSIAFVRTPEGSTAKEIHTIAPDGTQLRNEP